MNGHSLIMEGTEEISLFQDDILYQLDFTQSASEFNPPISAAEPGPGLRVRSLKSGDDERGFLSLLGQLTSIGDISRKEFLDRFNSMKENAGTYYVTVIEDTNTNDIVGAGTLVVEKKFIRNCATRGLVEDVIVSNDYRGRQLGKLILVTLTLLAETIGCYKVCLNCKDKLIKFYTGIGYEMEEENANFLQKRLKKK